MGSQAEIFVFDYERYCGEVVPALVELLRTGEAVPWLDDVFRSLTHMDEDGYDVRWPRLASQLRDRPADLARHCTWLGGDLRYVGVDPVDRYTGKQLTCRSVRCPERLHCRYHREVDRLAAEDLNELHEALVATRCLGPSQFLGRNSTPNDYVPVLHRQGVSAGDPLRGLLAALATRGAAVGYQFGVGEGIHGWLTVAETAELAVHLDRLDLPRYEPTFAAMEETFAAMEDMMKLSRGDSFIESQWQDMSLSFVRTVATIAANGGRAVLWGNSVLAKTWRETFGVVG